MPALPGWGRGAAECGGADWLSRASRNRVDAGGADAVRRAARTCLDVFDSTWGFFALHLVTSSHAMRLCAPFAGPDAERLTWAGVLAGYLCIGAPPPRDDGAPRVAAPDLAVRDPEHLVKLAWSARSQSRAFGDPAFVQVASRYLDGTDPLSIA